MPKTELFLAVVAAQTAYLSGSLSEEDYLASAAGPYLECSNPFSDGGDYVCPICLSRAVDIPSEETFKALGWDN